MEKLKTYCLQGERDAAVQVLRSSIADGTFNTDIFMNCIYCAAAEDHDPKVRRTLVAVCSNAPDELQDILKLDIDSFLKGTSCCWSLISAAYDSYYSNMR